MIETDIQMEALSSADLEDAHGLSLALNWPYRIEDWAFAFSLGAGVALRHDGRLIGTGLHWNYGPDFATVGMIIVDGAYRGQRLGSRIVDGLLEGVGDRSVILNATLDGLELYRRRGFKGFDVTCQHQGIAKPATAVDLDRAIEPATNADWPAMMELDQGAAGMPRGDMLKALAKVGKASVLRDDDGGVRGYAVCREFGHGHVIGPVIAQDADEAAALIAHAMADLSGRFVRVNTSARSGLGEWLEARGLEQVGTEEAMVRGTLPNITSKARIFALCSNSLG